mmetsp:Transcript_2085/g.3972  ORF Transcript_2085/g.3972 Transcript_2085/m.3972 type:complete len:494 (-) Transcript_2085:64-1545(-)|eukprot:CAMPEP_0184530342 /NCGR_PEP_ID=MMETSP0198_2-20121128/12895_1 /TAXON_ID=1112570 /ORGANISM="Thraustochytrium sp., Strain LLF1b" /LENGTH=493 /DNA_ID=CAMNT_0026922491 /DNA_START=125 /DNA_END=1606 /DNA_ORIENTATION=-
MDIFCAARAGDLSRVKELVEARPEIVNERYFDATALYYSCLCGHIEIVQYLLEMGSCAAEDTFDGDRCIYGALTDDIRRVLKQYAQRKTFVLSKHCDALFKLFTSQVNTDLTFEVQGEPIHCHRVIVAARVPGFAKHLRKGGTWYRRTSPIHVKHITRTSFLSLMRYCYSDVLECLVDDVEYFIRLCNRGGLPGLAKAVMREQMLLKFKPTLRQVGDRTRIMTITKLRPLGRDRISRELGTAFLLMKDLTDSCVSSMGKQFAIHSPIVSIRSEFFKMLLSEETQRSFKSQELMHDPRIVETCLLFLYTDGPGCTDLLFPQNESDSLDKDIQAERLLALIDLACEALLPDLCTFAMQQIVELGLVADHNTLDWLEVAKTYSPAKDLERACFRVIGTSLNTLLDEEKSESRDKLGVEPSDTIGTSFSLDAFRAFLESCPDITTRDYYIAEVREEFIEALPPHVDQATRDRVTDHFESLLGYANTGAPHLLEASLP